MNSAAFFGDSVLVGYECRAVFPDGTTDTFTLYEPQASSNPRGPTALGKSIGFREMYITIGATVSFSPIWLCRAEAIARGYIARSENGQ